MHRTPRSLLAVAALSVALTGSCGGSSRRHAAARSTTTTRAPAGSETTASSATASSGASGSSTSGPGGGATTTTPASLSLSSPDFSDGGPLPVTTTCDGEDRSPTLRIRGVPPGTNELALIVSDPDAPGGTFVHWVVHGLPPKTTELGPGVAINVPNTDGTNDFDKAGWGGPCPPAGPAHHYVFELMALDRYLGLASGVRADALRAAANGHVLQTARLTGTYARR